MVYLEKCCLDNYENLRLINKTHKSWSWWTMSVVPLLKVRGRDGHITGVHWSTNLVTQGASGSMKGTVSKNKAEGWQQGSVLHSQMI